MGEGEGMKQCADGVSWNCENEGVTLGQRGRKDYVLLNAERMVYISSVINVFKIFFVLLMLLKFFVYIVLLFLKTFFWFSCLALVP